MVVEEDEDVTKLFGSLVGVLGPWLARFLSMREIHGGPGVVCLGGTARCGCFCLAKKMSDAGSSGGRTTEGKMEVKSAEDVD